MPRLRRAVRCLLALLLLGPGAAQARVYVAGPDDFRHTVRRLQAGDTLFLKAGTYTRILPLHGLHGEPGRPIVISGPRPQPGQAVGEGPRARFVARSPHPLVSLLNASHVTVRNLELDGNHIADDGVKCEGHARYAHHITLQDLYIHDVDTDQQEVGISTKCPAWGWVIRGNVIHRAGTGMYLGNSDGSDPFVAGLIEHNLVYDTLGYNLQVKHQRPRPPLDGMPGGTSVTTIRYNVFSKAAGGATGHMARPNVLVGHWPVQGPGKEDLYDVYGNVFYENPTETLFQGTGNLALHDNLLINRLGSAVAIQRHEQQSPRRVWVFHNTVLAADTGIAVRNPDPAYRQAVVGNAVLAAIPLHGGEARDNLTGPLEAAAERLVDPEGPLGELDLRPRPGKLRGEPIPEALWDDLIPWNRDFDGVERGGGLRGAYAGDGGDRAWRPALERRPQVRDSRGIGSDQRGEGAPRMLFNAEDPE